MIRRTLVISAMATVGLAAISAVNASAANESVLVFGASGRLGVAVVKPLLAAGHTVTAFVRPSSDRTALDGLDIEYAVGDVMTAEDVNRAIATGKFTVVINALSRRGNSDGAFYDVSQYHITAAAKAAGIKQIVFVGSLGAGKSREVYPDNRWKTYGPLLLEKDRAEQNIIASGIGYTIIRNDQIPSRDVPATGTAYLTEDQHARGIITRQDLGSLIASCVGAASCLNKIYHAVDRAKDGSG